MEIYHRDHWIIVVHTATWKDLTKWNEENTIIDWINHMGMIVERVFPVPLRLRREGHACEKDNMVYYVLSHISIGHYQVYNSRCQAVQGCSGLYFAVFGCTTWLYQAKIG